AQGAGRDLYALAPQGLDEQRAGEPRRLLDRADAHHRAGVDGDLAADHEALRPDALRADAGPAPGHRLDLGVDLDVTGPGPDLGGGGRAGPGGGGDGDVEDVVVDEDGAEHARPAAAAAGAVEEAVVDEHVPLDAADAALLHLAGQCLEPGQRV